MTIEQLLEALRERASVLEGELEYYDVFSDQWSEFYGRQDETYSLISLLSGNSNTSDYMVRAIEEKVDEDE